MDNFSPNYWMCLCFKHDCLTDTIIKIEVINFIASATGTQRMTFV